jgi:hypothetical protein
MKILKWIILVWTSLAIVLSPLFGLSTITDVFGLLYLFLVAAVIGYDLLVEKEDKKGGDKE